jgi:hypothetical protein
MRQITLVRINGTNLDIEVRESPLHYGHLQLSQRHPDGEGKIYVEYKLVDEVIKALGFVRDRIAAQYNDAAVD